MWEMQAEWIFSFSLSSFFFNEMFEVCLVVLEIKNKIKSETE